MKSEEYGIYELFTFLISKKNGTTQIFKNVSKRCYMTNFRPSNVNHNQLSLVAARYRSIRRKFEKTSQPRRPVTFGKLSKFQAKRRRARPPSATSLSRKKFARAPENHRPRWGKRMRKPHSKKNEIWKPWIRRFKKNWSQFPVGSSYRTESMPGESLCSPGVLSARSFCGSAAVMKKWGYVGCL